MSKKARTLFIKIILVLTGLIILYFDRNIAIIYAVILSISMIIYEIITQKKS